MAWHESHSTRSVFGQTAGVAALLFILAAGVSGFFLFGSLLFRKSPCTTSHPLLLLSVLGVPVALLAAAGVLAVAAFRPRIWLVVVALALPAGSLIFVSLVRASDAARQAACRTWSYADALRECGADRAHYRIDTSAQGHRTLVLTDLHGEPADFCLYEWTMGAGDMGHKVDEAVYEQARAARKIAPAR